MFDSLAARPDDESGLRAEAKALFSRLDTNKDGYIDKCELLKGFPQLEEKAADLIMAEVDEDGDGSISFDELVAAIQSVCGASKIPSDGVEVEGGGGEVALELELARVRELIERRRGSLNRLQQSLLEAKAYTVDTAAASVAARASAAGSGVTVRHHPDERSVQARLREEGGYVQRVREHVLKAQKLLLENTAQQAHPAPLHSSASTCSAVSPTPPAQV